MRVFEILIRTFSEALETFSVFCEISRIFNTFFELDEKFRRFGPQLAARSPFRQFRGLIMVKSSVILEPVLGIFGSGL